MKSKQQLNRRLLGLVLLAVSAILLSGHSQSVNAQQWTGPDGNNNISNANTTGKVGIGTTSPQKQLHVTGSPESTIRLEDTLNPNTAEVTVTYDYIGIGANRENISGHVFNANKATAAFFMYAGPNNSWLTFSTTPTNNTDAVERMRIDKNGNVGIGTTSPSDPLHLSSASGVNIRSTDSTYNTSSYLT